MSRLSPTVVFCLTICLSATLRAETDQQARVFDHRIKAEVNQEIRDIFPLVHSEIDARVVAGKVTLAGAVTSYRERSRIERRVAEIEGVRYVNNRIQVERVPIEIRHHQLNGSRRGRASSFNTTSKPPGTEMVRGLLASKVDDLIVIRGFRGGRVSATISDDAMVTLDGEVVSHEMLSAGLLVFAEMEPENGEMVARSLEAYSPK
ncbi:BON domain-containing protein [Stieleria varia]|uniref:BON domain protein n=1 Tax=Stieleria varia TaxID=2528005 RepID=A0A5C6AGD0_9BACT|nr:BON domain-containing protein [Stieleria varia]TWT98358.1 BON domain protein [Stieleria varia]